MLSRLTLRISAGRGSFSPEGSLAYHHDKPGVVRAFGASCNDLKDFGFGRLATDLFLQGTAECRP